MIINRNVSLPGSMQSVGQGEFFFPVRLQLQMAGFLYFVIYEKLSPDCTYFIGTSDPITLGRY